MLEDRRFILFSARCYITADYENVPWRDKHVPLSRRHDFSFSPHATIGIWKRSELKKKKKVIIGNNTRKKKLLLLLYRRKIGMDFS